MAKQTILLDPNAQAYSNDEIVGKVNAATANITRANAVESAAVDLSGKTADDLAESTTKKYAGVSGADFKKSVDNLDSITEGTTAKHYTSTEKTKLSAVEEGATADQTGAEVRDLIVALDDTARKIVITEPATSEFKVVSLQRDATGKIKVSYDDTAV